MDSILSRISFLEFLEQIPDGLFITDAERRIVYWNGAARELTGFSREEMIGKHCFDADTLNFRTLLDHELCGEESCPVFESVLTNRSPFLPSIVMMNTRSGKLTPISLSVGPLTDASGEVIGSIGLFRGMREEYQQRRLALEIQKRTITGGAFARGGVRVQTLYSPVEEIGGDYIEAFFLDDGSLVATVADATGHGMSASLFTMIYKTLLHSSLGNHLSPREVLTEVNQGFLKLAGIEGYYLCACIVRFDPKTGKGTYSSAGHPEGLIFEKDGEGYSLRRKLHIVSFMLGIEEDTRFEELEFSLQSSEFLLLASDGLFESECINGMAFGVPGVQRFFARHQGERPLEELLAAVRNESKFVRLLDDVSMLAVWRE